MISNNTRTEQQKSKTKSGLPDDDIRLAIYLYDNFKSYASVFICLAGGVLPLYATPGFSRSFTTVGIHYRPFGAVPNQTLIS
jgi:hypothetical protein